MRIITEYIRKKSLGGLSNDLHNAIKCNLQKELDSANIKLKVDLFPIIIRLLEEDQVPQQSIADWLKCDRHRMSRTLDELEIAGFIVRKNDPNSRRTNLICLTEYTKNNKENIHNAVLNVFDKAYKGFTETEIETTIHTLEKIIKNLD